MSALAADIYFQVIKFGSSLVLSLLSGEPSSEFDISAIELQSNRNLLKLFATWIQEDLKELRQSHKSFNGVDMPDSSITHRVRELTEASARADTMKLEEINEYLGEARDLIREIDEESLQLSQEMEYESAMSSMPG